MQVSLKWLREFVDIDFSPRILASRLTMAGLPLAAIEKPKGIRDTILHLEITSNRPDCLSMRGIVREVSAITRKRLQYPKVTLKEGKTSVSKWASVNVQDEKRCPRYTARVITGVKVRPSPRWLVERLKALGVRPVNVLVDITNLVLLEYGQPLHAFDLDKLEGKRIVVRRARTGEKLTTLDGTEHDLHAGTLVIADAKRPVALAGIMGGKDTEITQSTQTVLLEGACFDPIAVRRASRRTGLSSDSSYRFERGIDLDQVAQAVDRAAALMAELAGGEIVRGMIDMGRKRARPARVSLWPKKIESLLGTQIPKKHVGEILTGLGITILKRERERWWVQVPSWRSDLTRSCDLVEEVARLWGYDRIPLTLPQLKTDHVPRNPSKDAVWAIKERLSAAGLNEIMTYALLSREVLGRLGPEQTSGILAVRNPRSREQEVLRPTLLAGLLMSAAHNIHRRTVDLGIFEIGKVYEGQKENEPKERLMLGMIFSGNTRSNWMVKARPWSLFDLKGMFEHVGKVLGVPIAIKAGSGCAAYEDGNSLDIMYEDSKLGRLGAVSGGVCDSFDIQQPVWAGELDLEKTFSLLNSKNGFVPRSVQVPPHLPAVRYDISFVTDAEQKAGDLTQLIESAGQTSIHDAGLDAELSVSLFDHYQGKNIPKGKCSLTYALHFQPRSRTLLEEEVKKVREAVTAELVTKMKVQIRK